MPNHYGARYGNLNLTQPCEGNETIDILLQHRSQRVFDKKPLKDGQLELLVAAAQSASSSGMVQTWSVIALTTEEEKNNLLYPNDSVGKYNSRIIGVRDVKNLNFIQTCSVFLIWIADLHRVDFVLKSTEQEEFLDYAEVNLKAICDASIAAQNLAVAAESMGLAIVYCGAVRQLPIEFLVKEYNLPKKTFPLFGMAIGWGIDNTRVKVRLPQEFVLHYGKYNHMKNTSQFESYNREHYKQSRHASGYAGTIDTYEHRIRERLLPTPSKRWIGESLRSQGFLFK